MPIIDCFKNAKFTDKEIKSLFPNTDILNKEAKDLTNDEKAIINSFMDSRSDDILNSFNSIREQSGFDPIIFTQPEPESVVGQEPPTQSTEQVGQQPTTASQVISVGEKNIPIIKVGDKYFRAKKDGTPSKQEIKNNNLINEFNQKSNENEQSEIPEQREGESIQQRGEDVSGTETNTQQEADQGSQDIERPQQQEGVIDEELPVGFVFTRNGKRVEVAPPQEGDPATSVRVRNEGTTGKGSLVNRENLKSKLKNPANQSVKYRDKQSIIDAAYQAIFLELERRGQKVTFDEIFNQYKHYFISPEINETELRTAIEAKRKLSMDSLNKQLESDTPYLDTAVETWDKFVMFFKRHIRNNLRGSGPLGRDKKLGIENNAMMEHIEDKRGYIQSFTSRATVLTKKLNRLRKRLSAADDAMLDKIIKGGSLDLFSTNVSEDLKKQLGILTAEMRDIVDGLSAELSTLGVLEEPFLEIVKDNTGKYITRIYMRDINKNWHKDVPKRVWNNAKRIYRQEFFKALNDGRVKPDKKDYVTELLSNDKLMDNFMEGVLRKRTEDVFAAKGSIQGSKDTSILKKRKDIPQEIREFYGEITDAGLSFAGTVEKLANFIANTRLLDNIQKTGWDKVVSNVRKEPNWIELNKSNSDTLTPLESPIYMDPDVYKFLELKKADIGWATKYALAINGVIKEGKTVFSPVTQIRNFLSATSWMVSNGVLDPRDFNDARKIIMAARKVQGVSKDTTSFEAIFKSLGLGKMDINEANALWDRMVKYQVADQNIVSREARDIFYDAFSGNSFEEIAAKVGGDNFKKLVEKYNVGDIARSARDIPRQLYSDVDDFYRISYFLKERRLLAKALHNKKPSELTVKELETVEREAARVVKNTYPNYSKIYPAVAKLRKVPFIGPFVSFSAEMLRTTRNQMVQAAKEINSGNETLQKNGAMRVIGLSANAFMTFGALNWVARSIFGFDDEIEKDIIFHRAPWEESLIPIENLGNGKYTVFNPSTINPYGYFSDIVNAWGNADTSMEGAAASIIRVLEPFLGPEISVSVAIQELTKGMEEGNLDYTGEALVKGVSNAIDALAPGIVYTGKRIIKPKATVEELRENPDIISEKRWNEMWSSITGVRLSDRDMATSFSLSVGPNILKEKGRALSEFNKVFKYPKREYTKEEIDQQYQESSQVYDGFLDEARAEASRLRRLGVPEDKLRYIHEKVNFNNKYVLNATERSYILGETDSKPILTIEGYNDQKAPRGRRKRGRR